MRKSITTGLDQMGLAYSSSQIEKLVQFIELLKKWNKVYNLTAVRNPVDMVSLHLLDSLSLLPHLENAERLLDIGSGAGLPGIPLAVFRPNQQFVLLDSNIKKTRFIQQSIIDLKLGNVQVVHERVEKYTPDDMFDCITTRAFATIAETLTLAAHLMADQSRILFMKSNTAESELDQIDVNYRRKIIELSVPGIEAKRSLVVLSR